MPVAAQAAYRRARKGPKMHPLVSMLSRRSATVVRRPRVMVGSMGLGLVVALELLAGLASASAA